MRSILERSGSLCALLCIALPVAAHHNVAMFDLGRDMIFEGGVTKFLWASPHVYLDIRADTQEGESITWTVEAASPQVMSRNGWSATSLAAGDHVVVVANPSRNRDGRIVAGVSVLKDDGTLLNMPRRGDIQAFTEGLRTLRAPLVARDLSGQWLSRPDMSVLAQFLQPRNSWSLTVEGIAAVEAFDPYVDNPYNDCIVATVPYRMLLPDLVAIEVGEEVTLIRQEEHGDRTVHMNLDSHDGAEYSDQGHSIGWWEEDVLVVDTTHFADHREGNADGLPSGPEKHLVERFTLSSDGTGLEYSFRLEDPEYLVEPVTATGLLTYRPDLPFVSLPCDLESARRYLEQ